MRKQIVAGNWKMNMNLEDGKSLASEVINIAKDELKNDVQLVVIPPATLLSAVGQLIGSTKNIGLGAQNCHQAQNGAYTGEISVEMIKSCRANYVIIGHSERRAYFHEHDELLAEKVKAILNGGLQPIFCCGETLEEREQGNQEIVVGDQVENALFELSESEIQKVVIAYEPVWAIGTGKTATAEQAQEIHAFIRTKIKNQYSEAVAENISILYGGSVKPANAQEIFSKPDVDGGLIGGASLKSRDFITIAQSF